MRIDSNKQEVLNVVDGLIKSKLDEAASLVEKSAVDNCRPHWTKLKPSIQRVVEGRQAFVGTDLEHGPYIEMGTKAHEILPRRAQALRFWVNGVRVFARRVWHPGFAPIPFLRPALESNKNNIRRIFGAK